MIGLSQLTSKSLPSPRAGAKVLLLCMIALGTGDAGLAGVEGLKFTVNMLRGKKSAKVGQEPPLALPVLQGTPVDRLQGWTAVGDGTAVVEGTPYPSTGSESSRYSRPPAGNDRIADRIAKPVLFFGILLIVVALMILFIVMIQSDKFERSSEQYMAQRAAFRNDNVFGSN